MKKPPAKPSKPKSKRPAARQPAAPGVVIQVGSTGEAVAAAAAVQAAEDDPFAGLTDEERRKAESDQQFWSALAGEGGCRVYKVNRRTHQPEYCGSFPKEQIRNDLDFIGREYGCGDYKFEPANPKGQFMTRVSFSYSPAQFPDLESEVPPSPEAAAPDPDKVTTKDVLEAFTNMMKAQAGSALTLKDVLPLVMGNKGEGFTEKMALMLVEKMIERGPGENPAPGPDRPFGERMAEMLLPYFGPQLAAGMAKLTLGGPAAPAGTKTIPPAPVPPNPPPKVPASISPGSPPVVQTGQVAVPAAATPAGTGAASSPATVAGITVAAIPPAAAGGNGKMDPLANELKPWLPMLAEYAGGGSKVEKVADFIIKAIQAQGKDWALDALVEKPDPAAYLMELEPKLAPYKEWLVNLVECFRPIDPPEPVEPSNESPEPEPEKAAAGTEVKP